VPSEAEVSQSATLAGPRRAAQGARGASGTLERAGRHGAGRWPARGVRFAFSSEGLSRPETFHAHVRTALAAGLSSEAAVDALTRRAAEIAGLGDRLGTIEPGKLGHLVVLNRLPYGGVNGRIRYVLIDGLKFDMERPAGSRPGPPGGNGEEKKARPDEPKPRAAPRRAPRAQEGKPAESQPPAPATPATPAPAAPANTQPLRAGGGRADAADIGR